MLSYFRINDPYRLVLILLLLLIIRFPVFFDDLPLTIPELEWMVIGEKLSEGATLYVGLRDNIGPFSAYVYWFIDELFGRSQLAFQILSIVILMVQAGIFNTMLFRNKVYNENSYVPALIYVLLMNSFFDMYSLSPVLMGLTFILLAVYNSLDHLDKRSSDESFLNSGIFISVASLFYLPLFLFAIPVLLSSLFFRTAPLKRYLLLFYGFLLPFLIVWLYYYWNDSQEEFYSDYLFSIFLTGTKSYIDLKSLVFVAMVPIAFLVLSLYKLFTTPRFTNHQIRQQQTMFMMMIIGLIALLFVKNFAPYQLLLFIIPAGFFITHYFLAIERRWVSEVVFAAFFAMMMYVNYGALKNMPFVGKLIDITDLTVKPTRLDNVIKDKKILVLGTNLSYYKNSKLATPYLNWHLSKNHLQHPDYYDNLSEIYNNFRIDLPQVIIDEEDVILKLFDRMPGISEKYKKQGQTSVYFLEEGNR